MSYSNPWIELRDRDSWERVRLSQIALYRPSRIGLTVVYAFGGDDGGYLPTIHSPQALARALEAAEQTDESIVRVADYEKPQNWHEMANGRECAVHVGCGGEVTERRGMRLCHGCDATVDPEQVVEPESGGAS